MSQGLCAKLLPAPSLVTEGRNITKTLTNQTLLGKQAKFSRAIGNLLFDPQAIKEVTLLVALVLHSVADSKPDVRSFKFRQQERKNNQTLKTWTRWQKSAAISVEGCHSLFIHKRNSRTGAQSTPHADQLRTGCDRAALGCCAHGQTAILQHKLGRCKTIQPKLGLYQFNL